MNEEQLLAQRDELARENHLGELVLYRTPWISVGKAIYARVIAGVALALLLLLSCILLVSWVTVLGPLGPVTFVLVVLFFVLLVLFYVIFLTDDTAIYVYSKGLVCLRRSGGRVVHWGEIRQVKIAGYGRSTRLSARLNDGSRIPFPNTFSHGSTSYRHLQQFIEGKIIEAQIPFV
jgi:hypothetical protein